MSKVQCALCSAEKQESTCEVIQLTEEEKAQIPNAPEQYHYCRPCWRILKDPVNSTALLRGLVQSKLRALGVEDQRAEAAALRFVQKLQSKRA